MWPAAVFIAVLSGMVECNELLILYKSINYQTFFFFFAVFAHLDY